MIFDLDGTLADTEPLVLGCMLETINAHGHAVDRERLLQFIGPPLPVMLFHMLGLSAEQAQPIYMDYLRRYEESYMPRTTPLAGAEALLDELAAADVPLAVVTNKREDAGRKTVELLGLDRSLPDDHRRGHGQQSEAARRAAAARARHPGRRAGSVRDGRRHRVGYGRGTKRELRRRDRHRRGCATRTS